MTSPHFLRFFTPSSPLPPIILNRHMEQCHLLVDPPPRVGDVIYGRPKAWHIYGYLQANLQSGTKSV